MKKIKSLVWLLFLASYTITLNEVHASHSEGADLTYKCLGGNQYELTVSFYRDCNGINAPSSAIVNCFSSSTNQNFNLTLQPVPGTGQEISLVCASVFTQCQGGPYPGVQEWVYKATTTISPAVDWIFSFDLCCRNTAITTIASPGAQNIYVEATLDNLNFPCNSSPVFTTKPIPFVCLYQNYTFNHGAGDPDGDLITYELVTPMNGPNSTITYLLPYTATQPLTTTPAMSFDTVTGDINMMPTMLEVTVLAVKVKQWKNNQLTGTVMRDMQLRTMNCNNSYPYINGINGTGMYSATYCVGSTISFNIYTFDPNPTQTLTLTWNNAISGAAFTVSGGQNPTGTFSWTPTYADIGTHCFTITVTDNNCPINGSLTYAICLVVYGVDVSVSTTSANCNASNGTATAIISGGTPPFTYQWLPCLCNNNPLNGLQPGTYTAVVTDAKGCTASDTGTVASNPAPGNVNMSFTAVSCYGVNDGTATANVNGGLQPYTYLWSNGNTTSTATGLFAGTHYVTVTTANGCVTSDSILINQPLQLSVSVTQNDALCFGMSNGSASVSPSGGTSPYSYLWNNGQITQSITGLSAGNYFVTTTDSKGCVDVQNVTISQPAQVLLNIFSISNVSCFGGNNGTATAVAYGGISPYSFMWNTIPIQISQTATGLSAGNYIVTVLDSNGCTAMTPVNISEPPVITSTINSASAICYGSSTGSAAAATVAGGSPPYSYLWSNGQTTSSATNLSAGTYSLVITDMYGCSQINTTTIFQPSLLSAGISNIQNVSCNKIQDGSALANGNGGVSPYSYSWSNGQTSANATGLDAQTYSVTVTDSNGCTATAAVTITQPPAMTVTLSPDDIICPGQNTTISASAAGGTNPYTYFWQPNVGFGNSQTVSPSAATTYTVIITDVNGCTATGAITISVYNLAISLTAIATPAICSGQSATVSAISNSSNIISYYWSNGLGNGAGPYTVSPASTTTYSVTIVNNCGATATAAATILVHPLPQVSLPSQSGIGCGEVTLQFSDTNSVNNSSTHLWNFGDGSISTQTNPSHAYAQTGNYTVSVTVISSFGCFSSAQTICSIEVIPSPAADFTSDPPLETSIINPVFHFTDLSVNTTIWNWDFGDGQTSSQKNPVHTYYEKGIYTVKLVTKNSAGCIDSIIKTVEVKPEFTFYIPNTFTPNGDHLNDVFIGKGMEITEYNMQIFDRWGEMIYETEDLEKGWDGTANRGSEISHDGVYVYKIKLRDFEKREHNYIGNVNLLR